MNRLTGIQEEYEMKAWFTTTCLFDNEQFYKFSVDSVANCMEQSPS